MDNAQEQVEELLKENGAELVRSKKHKVYRLADGRIFTTASTPSDIHSWNNCLRALHRLLGMQATSKTQADFEHRQREHRYSKPVIHRKRFLGDLPERDERPPTPVSESPLVALKRKLEAEAKQKELEEALIGKAEDLPTEREVFSIGGKLPLADHRMVRRYVGGRSGRVVQYSKEKIAELNLGLSELGRKKVGMERVEEKEMVNPVETNVSGGSIEAALRSAKQELEKHRAAESAHHLEAARYEQIVSSLEQTVRLVMAPRASLREFIGGGNGSKPAAKLGSSRENMRPRGFWTDKIKEVVGTTPISLVRARLVQELMKEVPDAKKDSIYQAVLKGLKDGFIYEDAEKFVRVK